MHKEKLKLMQPIKVSQKIETTTIITTIICKGIFSGTMSAR